MSWLKFFELAPVLVLLTFLCSCGQRNVGSVEEHTPARDNILRAKIISIDEELPPIHSFSGISVLGDTLIVIDDKSTDKQYYAYDLKKQKELGWFGQFGGGPGELVNYMGKTFDKRNHIIYGIDFGPMEIKKIDIRRALNDSTYSAETILKIDPGNGYFTSGYCVNDSTLFTSWTLPDTTHHTMHTLIVRYNLMDGSVKAIEKTDENNRKNSFLLYNPHNGCFVTFCRFYDLMRFYDSNGNLEKTIYGPDYKNESDGRTAYFFSAVNDKNNNIYTIYSGKDYGEHKPHDVIVMDSEGKYLKTLHFDCFVWNMAYHKPTNRLYLSTDGEPQFGYINLDDY